MKTVKAILPLLLILIMSSAARAYVLFQDSTYYPYTNGCIEGQGKWYTPSRTPLLDALVTNNVLLLYSNHLDYVEAPTNVMTGPTNGWVNTDNPNLTYASFRVMVTQLPVESGDDDFFFQFRDSTNSVGAGRVFIDTLNTSVPGTFRLGVANFDTEFGGADSEYPPVNYPEDLATDTWYTVVIAYGNNSAPAYAVNATLWINPSLQDYTNFLNGVEYDNYTDTNAIGNYVYGTDPTDLNSLLNINVAQLEFMPGSQSGSEGISNVIAGSEFADVYNYNLPVFGIQPLWGYTNSTETNYIGNNETFYAVASGVDLAYQWYSQNYGKLTNGMNYANGDGIFGSTNNTLVVSNLSLTDTYYCEVTDAYRNTATSSNATEVVITTPTAPFFPSSETNVIQTNNLFTYVNFYNPAKGTGPISYQWYFAPTNLPITYSPLVGSNQDYINLYLTYYTNQGSYYVVASNSVDGGSIAYSPTNTLVTIAPSAATLQQLNQLYTSFLHSGQTLVHNTTYYLNQGGSSGSLTVAGYVTTYGVPVPGDTNLNGLAVGGLGNSYAEYYIQDTNGYGAEVYGYNFTNNCQPPIGTYITISGPIEVYNDQLEVSPTVSAVILNTNTPPITIAPVLANAEFSQLATNMTGNTALAFNDKIVTFTNVYCYGNSSGAPINGSAGGNSGGGYNYNGIFLANHANSFYFTVGSPYNPAGANNNPAFPINTNLLECYQFNYDYPYNQPTVVANPFDGLTMQTNYYQLTGVYAVYGIPASPEILPSRVADYVVNPPPSPVLTVAVTNSVPTVTWSPNVGSTYSVYSAANILGPWTQAAYGLSYYPTNGTFTDNNKAKAKFYQVTSP